MSFSGGVFSINTTGQPVVADTSISASVFNAFTADIATGLSTCMLKDGTQTATAGIGFFAGTVSLPGIYLGTDTATGLYRIGLNNDGYAVNGAKVLDISSSGLGVVGQLSNTTGPFIAANGSVGAPSIQFAAGATTGFYSLGANAFNAVANGASVLAYGVEGVQVTGYYAGTEQTAPSAPAANGYRIYAQDNGGGKTQLMVIFASGAAQQLAIQP